ncbi:MAG: hypothetical protein ACR2J6_00495 [Thermoleophilaceae bacterium]
MGTAASTALRGQLDEASQQAVAGAVGRMEAALRAHRLGSDA